MSHTVGIRTRILSVLALPFAAACAGPPLLPAPTGAARCTVPGVGTAEAPWRRVRATGFTFCVPPHWRPDGPGTRGADALTWTGDNGSITWGRVQTEVIRRDIVAMRVGPDGQPDLESLGITRLCSTPLNFQLYVDGLTIETTQHECQGGYFTSASLGQSLPQLTGQSRSGATAELQMQIYRTIRLAPPTP